MIFFQNLYRRPALAFDESAWPSDDTNLHDFSERLLSIEINSCQQQIQSNNPDNSYDFLERDLVYLRAATDELETCINQYQHSLSRIKYLENLAQYPAHTVASFIQRARQNLFLAIASGTMLSEAISAPIRRTAAPKICSLMALSGSMLGTLATIVMHPRNPEGGLLPNDDNIKYDYAML